jgi:hypothetical protein
VAIEQAIRSAIDGGRKAGGPGTASSLVSSRTIRRLGLGSTVVQLALPVARHRCKASNRVFAVDSFIALCIDDGMPVPVPRTRSVSPFTTRHHARKQFVLDDFQARKI